MEKGGAWAPGCVIQPDGRLSSSRPSWPYTRPEPKFRLPAVLVNGSSKYQHRQHEHGRETALFPDFLLQPTVSRVTGSITFVFRSMAKMMVRCSNPSRLPATIGKT